MLSKGWFGLIKGRAFLKHILDEIEYLTTTSQSVELNGVINDPHLQRSFIRNLEVIGEATKNLSKDLKNNHPEIEWRKIAGNEGQTNSILLWRGLGCCLGCCEE